ncbi:MAG TPA: NUDIX hydrolase [Planosporangium sp.]|jgi:ADP-ribose pyrophosphatase YjhB (NUDIX family)|nr:NUDIX hydrolase [Planosporangium sp.]
MSQLTSAVNADASTFVSAHPSTSVVAAVISDDAGRLLLCQLRQGHPLWGLPGGRIRDSESPIHAVIREILADTGAEIELSDLVGLYQLTGDGCGDGLPDVVVHVFRAKLRSGEVAVNAPGRVVRLSWHDPDTLPESMTATTRAALPDAVAGRSGVLRAVHRDLIRERTDITGAAPPTTVAATG